MALNNKQKEEKIEKKETNKEKRNIDYKALVIWVIFGIALIVFVIFLYRTFFATSFSNKEIDEIIANKGTQVIYVMNSDSDKCKNCAKIKKHLEDKSLNYKIYDVKKVGNSSYKKLLDNLSIDDKVFNYPAIIYIKDGSMYSNIINIEDTKVVDQFIKDYNLK